MSTEKIFFALLASLIAITGAFALVPEMSPSGRFSWPADAPAELTPARLQLQKMLEAFNSGNREVLEKYRVDNVSPFWRHPPDNDAALWWQKTTGGWVPVALEDKSPTSVVALLRNVDSDDLFLMGANVELAPPHRLVSIELEYATEAPARFWPEQVSDAEAMDLLRKDLARRVSLGKFSGAVLVEHGDEALFRQGFGFADREANIPNSPDTRFRIGAMGNMFTAVAIMRLVQDRRLAMSDRVGQLLPELADDPAGKLTIEQLLTHTGGTDDVEHLGWKMDLRSLRTHSDYVAEFGDGELLFSPETGQVIVVLANFDEPTAKNVSRFIAARLPGPEYDIPHVQLSKTEFARGED